ncbi:thiol-disulfide oxidoreductase DCC family protein [Alicyclobacillus fodiniaquatilis]|jgi:predicted DCC family thiol-disulfide oxidoreductase YuxK|uniref:Thiol-disulfide oxidoreductase DCC family protein n=1 Tax=Alicyclobacillus fodiniaquatilis TaxID=1661150 RepID=A0ABW4JA61_9BACL
MSQSISETSVILFDGVCNLCNAAINFIIPRDTAKNFRFAALQSEAGSALVRQFSSATGELNSLILLSHGRMSSKSTAVLRIARELDGLWPICYVFIAVPRPLRDAVYDFVARHRYKWFGRRDKCMIPTADMLERFL